MMIRIGSGCYVLDGQLEHEGGSQEEGGQDWQNSPREAASCYISYKLTLDTPASMQNITAEQRIPCHAPATYSPELSCNKQLCNLPPMVKSFSGFFSMVEI